MTTNQPIETEVLTEKKEYFPAIERLRIILMFFMCINLFGLPTVFGSILKTVCGFVPLAFFILSGYLVLRDSEDRSARILRTIKRTGITFIILTFVYFGINLLYYNYTYGSVYVAYVTQLLTVGKFWLNFLLFNVWQFDIGSAIWYVQALLYAYVILYFLDKWNLLRYDIQIAGVLILFTMLTGELAGVIRWNVAGYTYLPGNFLTRALPYLLIGSFIRRNISTFRIFRRSYYYATTAIGIILTLAEIMLLSACGVPGYYGHVLGMGITAMSVCLLAFTDREDYGFDRLFKFSRRDTNFIYYLCQPVSIGLALILAALGSEFVTALLDYVGILTFVFCFLGVWLVSFAIRVVKGIRLVRKLNNETND